MGKCQLPFIFFDNHAYYVLFKEHNTIAHFNYTYFLFHSDLMDPLQLTEEQKCQNSRERRKKLLEGKKIGLTSNINSQTSTIKPIGKRNKYVSHDETVLQQSNATLKRENRKRILNKTKEFVLLLLKWSNQYQSLLTKINLSKQLYPEKKEKGLFNIITLSHHPQIRLRPHLFPQHHYNPITHFVKKRTQLLQGRIEEELYLKREFHLHLAWLMLKENPSILLTTQHLWQRLQMLNKFSLLTMIMLQTLLTHPLSPQLHYNPNFHITIKKTQLLQELIEHQFF